jgi:hypothetical protein
MLKVKARVITLIQMRKKINKKLKQGNREMEKFNVDIKLLKEQIKAVLESNMEEDIKAGLHNLLGDILDNCLEENLVILGRYKNVKQRN